MTENEDIPYRTPAAVAPVAPSSDQDQADYSTLNRVQAILKKAIADLHKNFNAFDIPRDKGRDEAVSILLRQIDGKQEAYDVLVAVESLVDSAINNVKQTNSGE